MNIETIKDIFVLASKRSIKKQYRYFVLDKTRLSEPEVRHVMTKILEERKTYYAIEKATEKKHRISGATMERRALTDLVIYGKGRSSAEPIWVEFKRGQPEIGKIKKDFIKMVKEPSIKGVCFFHILPKVSSKTIKLNERAKKAIIEKYYNAYRSIDRDKCEKKWFVLFILDGSSRQWFYLHKIDIRNIDSFDGRWEALG